MLDELNEQINELQKQIQILENLAALQQIPPWAEEAVQAAVSAGILTEPNNGSYDFYRIITILYRKGII
jgi:S-layer homology domain